MPRSKRGSKRWALWWRTEVFTVSIPAADRNLLSLAEMKAALGVTGNASDAALTALGAQISDMIAHECHVPVDGVTPPTLRSETIVETLRNDLRYSWRKDQIVLTRRFVTSIASVVVAGVTLVSADYEVDGGAGLLRRVNEGGTIICWPSGVIVVAYVAGFATVPEPLKLAAATILREQWSVASQGGAAPRDPLLKRERVEGIGDSEWFGSTGGSSSGSRSGAFSSMASAMLDPFRYIEV